MGGTNPDTLSGATITVERRTGQMEARALGGPSYLLYIYICPGSYITRSHYETLPAVFPSILPASLRTRQPRVPGHKPYDGADGLAASPWRTSADHIVFILLKQQDGARRDYRKRVSAISRRQKLQRTCGFYYYCALSDRTRKIQSWMLSIGILLIKVYIFLEIKNLSQLFVRVCRFNSDRIL